MQMQFTVLGAKSFNDSVDGVKYNTTKVRVLMDEKVVLSDVRNVVGFDAVDIEFGDSTEFVKHKLGSLTYPIQAMLDVKPSTKGFVCQGFQLVPSQNQPKG